MKAPAFLMTPTFIQSPPAAMIKRLLLVTCFAAPLGLASCSPPAQNSGEEHLAVVEIVDATCRPTAIGRDITACYMVLTASRDDRLVSVASPLAASIEIHEMATENGMMTMRALEDGLALAAGEAVRLEAGGNHLMLLGLAAPLGDGETVPLTLTFENAAPVSLRANVRQPSLPGMSPETPPANGSGENGPGEGEGDEHAH